MTDGPFTPPPSEPPPSTPPTGSGYAPPSGYPPPPTPSAWDAPAPGPVPGAAQPPSYGFQQGYGYASTPVVVARTNGLAVAALVCGLVGILLLQIVFGPLAIIFGAIARRQIANSNGAQKGNGMAMAGLILGPIDIGLFIVTLVYFDEIQDFIERNSNR